MKIDTTDLKFQVRKDPLFRRFKEVVDLNSQRINVESLINEVKEVSEMRTRTAVKYNQTPSELIKALVQENLTAQAYRSRLAEICLQATRVIAQIDRACDKIRDHINLKYLEEIKSLGRTKDERALISNTVLRFATNYTDELGTLIEMAELIIADIDKQHYSLKLTKESVELLVNRESILS